jgi:putative ABC transport system permease protein
MELKLALRSMRRYPLVFGLAALAIGFSVAVCASMFSVLDGILFRPIPLPGSDRVALVDYPPVNGRQPVRSMLPEFASERERSRLRLTGSGLVAAYADARLAIFFDAYELQRQKVSAQAVDSHFFPLLGVQPVIGTNFSVDDERAASILTQTSGQPLPIIMSNSLWKRTFAGMAISDVHAFAGREVRVVGVLPPGVKYPGETDIWVALTPRTDRPPSHIRLASGVSVSQVQSLVPELRVRSIREAEYPEESTAVALLFGSALVLLLTTWVQVSGMVLLWASGQATTAAIRFALGAEQRHLLRQFAIQGGCVAAASFAVAVAVIRPLTGVIISLLPREVTHGQYLEPDWRTLFFLGGLSVCGFSLLSWAALRGSSGISAIDALRTQPLSGPIRRRGVRPAVLTMQIALTATLLYVSGLAAHSYINAVTLDYGFDAARLVMFTPPRPFIGSASLQERMAADDAFRRRLNVSIEHVVTLTGVTGAATAFSGPLGIANQPPPKRIESIDGRATVGDVHAIGNSVTSGFIEAMGATLIQGLPLSNPELRTGPMSLS